MIIILKHEEYLGKNGRNYFVEKYRNKYVKTPFWRYGFYLEDGYAFVISHSLFKKPNMKKLNII